MTEDFLAYLWQFQYFDKKNLKTQKGEPLEVLAIGKRNSNQGADFQGASLRIGKQVWHGSVELHLHVRDWLRHAHEQDSHYNNVILHLVWEDEKAKKEKKATPILRQDKTPIPTLELKSRVSPHLLEKYYRFLRTEVLIPCQAEWATVSPLIKTNALKMALLQRLERKSNDVFQILNQKNNDWEETSYIWLLRHFGFKVNNEPFARLAEILPFKSLRKVADNPHLIEALIFGMAGFLENPTTAYQKELAQHFSFYVHKNNWQYKNLKRQNWNFLRLRPANFPTVRLAQVAALLQKMPHLFSALTEWRQAKEVIQTFSIEPSTYWQAHYDFDKKWKSTSYSNLGKSSIENLLINVVSILTYSKKKYYQESDAGFHSFLLLKTIKAESNQITEIWDSLNEKSNLDKKSLALPHAGATQGFIELYSQACQQRACLNCIIGKELLK
ncbi:DUF2851 family protein [Hugenholtzia roseola]|uniref:DUF2851 family protein n=1 Tax=Hugenholtzia roseola TaxID=1002 RepID=UPI00041D4DFE|nr:DUF2851 family protein [Hugenholtzia roseola]